MFNFLSQHIACDFEASQPLFNAASHRVQHRIVWPGLLAHFIALCDRAYSFTVETWGPTKPDYASGPNRDT